MKRGSPKEPPSSPRRRTERSHHRRGISLCSNIHLLLLECRPTHTLFPPSPILGHLKIRKPMNQRPPPPSLPLRLLASQPFPTDRPPTKALPAICPLPTTRRRRRRPASTSRVVAHTALQALSPTIHCLRRRALIAPDLRPAAIRRDPLLCSLTANRIAIPDLQLRDLLRGVCARAAVAELAPDDRFVRTHSRLHDRWTPRARDDPAVRTGMLGFLFWRGAALGPGHGALHLRAEMILRALLVAQVRAVDADGREHLQDTVDEDPAAATGFERVERVEHVALLEADEVRNEVGVHVLVAQDVDVAGLGVGEGFAAGLRKDVGWGGGFLEGECGFGFGLDGDGERDLGVGVWEVRELVAGVKAEEDVGKGQIVRVGAEGLAGFGQDSPFLARAVFGAVEDDVAVDEVVVEAVEIVGETHDHVMGQPGVFVCRGPVQEGVFVVFAEPFTQALEAPSGGGGGGAGYGPHFVEVEGKEPDLGTVDALFDFHAGVLEEHLGVGCDVAPFWDGLKTHIEHSRAMHECFDVAFSPLHAWSFAECEQ